MFEPHFDPPLPPFQSVGVEIWFTQFEAALECNSIWIEEFKFEVLQHILPPDLQSHLRFNWCSPTRYVDMREAVLNYFGATYRSRPPTPTPSAPSFQLFSTTPTSCSTQSTSHDSDSRPATMSQACAESASTNLSESRNIPSINSDDAVRTASEERVSDVPLEPPGYSPTTTQAEDQHDAPTETPALIGGGCTTTGAPSDSYAGSRMPSIDCSVRPRGQSPLKVLLDLVMPYSTRLREEIEQVLDVELIRQQAEHGTLDFLAYARHVISLMARMCAPIRDASIKELLEIKEVVPLFRGIMEQLRLMKIDMANFSIQQARPLIQSHSVTYEQEQFKKYLEVQTAANPSADPLALTKAWLKRSYDHLRSLSDQHSPDPINGPGCKGPGFSSVLAGAYMELLSWPDEDPYPETLRLDEARYRALKDKVHLATLVASILSITYRLGGAALQGISDFKDDLKSHTQLLLEGSLLLHNKRLSTDPPCCSEEELRETLKSVASQVIKEVQECLQKHGFNQLQISQERVLYDQIVVMTSPDHHVRKLLCSGDEASEKLLFYIRGPRRTTTRGPEVGKPNNAEHSRHPPFYSLSGTRHLSRVRRWTQTASDSNAMSAPSNAQESVRAHAERRPRKTGTPPCVPCRL
ncbi:hypothetical protein HPB50_021802 [Hyalomma asiaticum]|uniref:Uncharacterized protein n=1 Tax=Hyalomma asiaticum TaxID=266040 RepID=A0ACB7RPS1_HYAAI|nr:hypothetical protein HPB50_021802 [Hyalomma asiaticum]